MNSRLQPWQGCTLPLSYSREMEAASRFELENGGFADLCLTTWLCRLMKKNGPTFLDGPEILERETRFELATPTLARLYSTTELFPLKRNYGKEWTDLSGTVRKIWSGKRDLNSRLQPWQGCTLPLSYSRRIYTFEVDRRTSRPISVGPIFNMERETRFELATPTLARLYSTTELFPRNGGGIQI